MSSPTGRRQHTGPLLLLCLILGPSHAEAQQTVARLAASVDGELAATLRTSSSTKKRQLSASLARPLARLREQSIMVFGSRRDELDEKLRQLIQSCEKW